MTASDELSQRLQAGERRALAQLLSLAESTRSQDERFLEDLLTAARAKPHGLRLGVTGIPGAGKSSLIDALGFHFVEQGRRVAVLAVDPSSPLSGGSILGDKVRMPRLSQLSSAFVRPLANAGVGGGAVYALDDCVRLCELAGYDVVMVETVGVGQNEVDVGLVCDTMLLLVVPGTGDEIQAIKRGITEVADAIAVNKADLVSAAQLENVEASYREGLSYLRKDTIPVLSCSAISGLGVEALASTLVSLASRGAAEPARRGKRQLLLRRMAEQQLLRKFQAQVAPLPEFEALTQALSEGRISLRDAVTEALTLTGTALAHPTCPRYPG